MRVHLGIDSLFVALELRVISEVFCLVTGNERGRDGLRPLSTFLDMVRRVEWRSSLLLKNASAITIFDAILCRYIIIYVGGGTVLALRVHLRLTNMLSAVNLVVIDSLTSIHVPRAEVFGYAQLVAGTVLVGTQIGWLRVVSVRRYHHVLALQFTISLHVAAEVALLSLLGALKYLTQLMCQRGRVHLRQRSRPLLLLHELMSVRCRGSCVLLGLLLKHFLYVLLDLLREHVLDGLLEAVLEAELAREVRCLVLLTPMHNDVFWR